jgi:oligopeptidase B
MTEIAVGARARSRRKHHGPFGKVVLDCPSMSIQARPEPPAEPPLAKQVPHERTFHGDTVTDEYAWIADSGDPDTISYLKAEKAYTEAATAGLIPLRDQIFAEIKARTQESDLSVPVRKGDWWQYGRTVQGQQYAVHCRRAVRPGEVIPPMAADGQPLDGEEVLLDGNELAAGQGFFALGAFRPSRDWRWLAYSADFTGDERFTIRIKDLATGAILPDEIPGAYYGCAWSGDGSALFYVTVDDAWRPYRVWRHRAGTPADQDVIVFEEADERFHVNVTQTRSERYLVINSASELTSEVWLLDAATPEAEFSLVAPRRQGVDYKVEHAGDKLLILHNDGAENFEIATAPLTDPADWTPLVAHRADTRLLGVDAFADFIVIYYRRAGLTGLRILHQGAEREIAFPEPIYGVGPGPNPEYESGRFRLLYTSMVTPASVYDCEMATGELTLLKRQPVLPSPAGVPYRSEDYEQHREWTVAADGTRVPISLVCRKGTPRDGSAPCLLYGYGSYEISRDPSFSIPVLSLLDRGFVYAIAHVRGGGEMGRSWYTDGKLLHKKNTFTDFIACAVHLERSGWTSAPGLIARGGSAGGLLVGAVANMSPETFGGIVAHVPFVDALNTILDPSLPLTVTEWEEWGDPLHDPQVYAYMKSYSPYENVTGQAYPPIFALGGLNDTRVRYHEPAKWMARLRAVAKGGPFLLKIEMEAGHGGRSGRYDAWREEALVLAWIVQTATADRGQLPPLFDDTCLRSAENAWLVVEQGADRLAVVDAADGLGQSRSDRQDVQLRVVGRDGCRVGAHNLGHVGGGQLVQRVVGEQAMRAGHRHRTRPLLGQPGQQLEHGRAARDLIVEDDHVPVGHVADDGGGPHLGIADPFLRARRHRHAEPAGEIRGALGVAEVRRHHHGAGQVPAAEVRGELAQRVQVIHRDGEEAVHLRRVQGQREHAIDARGDQ